MTLRQEHLRLYSRWSNMIRRCHSPSCPSYPRWGGRGIRVCDRWRTFSNFFDDMGEPPGPGYTLERIDNDGNYEPANVRWATYAEQRRNDSKTLPFSLNGERMVLKDLCARLSLDYHAVYYRLTHGWSLHVALTVPTGQPKGWNLRP